MEKPADNHHPIDEEIRRRWSPRAFADTPVPAELLRSLFEAARWAASSNNEQPWSFLVATKDDPAEYEKLLHCLNEKNQSWAKTAPVLALSVAKKTNKNGAENRFALHDTGAASALLAVQSAAHHLFIHQMGGFDAQKARETFHIPDDHEPVAAIALGYPGDPALLSDDLQQRETAPRQRRPLHEFVFGGKWGEWANL